MELPYSAMLPKNINGLLVTGRATGGDKISHAATRNMSCCSVTVSYTHLRAHET